MKLRNIFIVFSAAIVLLTAISIVSCQGEVSGGKAPDFTLQDLSGNPYSLSNASGKVIILDFWATWCPPCKMEIPHFQALYSEYASSGVEIIGIALDRGGASDVMPFVQQEGVIYPILISDQKVEAAYGGIRSIPTTFIIDRKGNIVEKVVGYRDKKFFEDWIKKLI